MNEDADGVQADDDDDEATTPWMDAGKAHLAPLVARIIRAVREDPQALRFFVDELDYGPGHLVFADDNWRSSDVEHCIKNLRLGRYCDGKAPESLASALAVLLCLRAVLAEGAPSPEEEAERARGAFFAAYPPDPPDPPENTG